MIFVHHVKWAKEEINDVAQEGLHLEEHWFQKATLRGLGEMGAPQKNDQT